MEEEDLKFHKNFEDELDAELMLDDAEVLSKRYVIRRKMNEIEKLIALSEKMSNPDSEKDKVSTTTPPPSSSPPTTSSPLQLAFSMTANRSPSTISQIARCFMKPTTISQIRKTLRPQTQWTRIQDAVQEHFSSHITIGNSTHKLPKTICALKYLAKHSWVLYKKRECERRKRIRMKLEKEKAKEKEGKPANILLSMVDMCEICKRLYVTVNLFWGVTLCDACYFNPHTINEIMKTRIESCEQKVEITSDSIAEEIIRQNNSSRSNQLEAILPLHNTVKNRKQVEPPSESTSPSCEDFRQLSSYVQPSHLYSTASEAESTSIPLENGNVFEAFETVEGNIFDTPFDFGVDIESLEDIEDEKFDTFQFSQPSISEENAGSPHFSIKIEDDFFDPIED